MPRKFVVSLTHGADKPDKATVTFVVANPAVASDKETVVFFLIEGTRQSQKVWPTASAKKASRH